MATPQPAKRRGCLFYLGITLAIIVVLAIAAVLLSC